MLFKGIWLQNCLDFIKPILKEEAARGGVRAAWVVPMASGTTKEEGIGGRSFRHQASDGGSEAIPRLGSSSNS
jgi:hypothetical protein